MGGGGQRFDAERAAAPHPPTCFPEAAEMESDALRAGCGVDVVGENAETCVKNNGLSVSSKCRQNSSSDADSDELASSSVILCQFETSYGIGPVEYARPSRARPTPRIDGGSIVLGHDGYPIPRGLQ